MKKRVYSVGSKSDTTAGIAALRPTVFRRLIGLASALACGVVIALAAPASAQPQYAQDSSYDALRQFAREMGLEKAQTQAAPKVASQDEAYSALLDFARMVDPEAPRTVSAAKAAPAKPAAKRENKGGEGDAYFVGSNKCMTCHAAVAAEFSKTLMGRIGRTTRKGTMECENCHGPGSKHVAAGGGRGVGGMVNFSPDAPPKQIEEANGVCLTCHQRGARTAWHGSTHETRGLACSNCHTVMRDVSVKSGLASRIEAEVCFQCHKYQKAQMQRSSHMPIREGKMTCSNCHNPHGSVNGTEAMIKQPSINDNCYTCHAEKRGPMLHEHAPVRENCLNCHDAHGSNHEYLLKVQRPRLCAECHSFAHGGQVGLFERNNYSFGHSCNNCHSQIHGSNHPGGAWFQR